MDFMSVIASIVKDFYSKAREDILLAYQFKKIADFDAHIPRIIQFWEWQILGHSPSFKGPPFQILDAHEPLKIKGGEIGRWMVLFRQTLDQHHNDLGNDQRELFEQKLRHFEKVFRERFTKGP
jgi:truncated hemoglobin YjbI